MNLEAAVKKLLEAHVGFSPSTLGDAAYDEAIAVRLRATGLARRAWYERLVTDPTELETLVEALVVPETWFFRDETPFVEVVRHAERRVAETGGRYRVLSLPCATGEETYSIAIALREAGFSPSQFEVDGVDVSTAALARAASGVYRAASFRSARAEVSKARWFAESAPGGSATTWTLSNTAREGVTFRRGNALAAATFVGLPRYDAIFCRNLLIYFDRPARETLVGSLRGMLGVGGLLFVGHAESLMGLDRGLRRLPEVRAFGYERVEEAETGALGLSTDSPRGVMGARTRTSTTTSAGTRERVPFASALPPLVPSRTEPRVSSASVEADSRGADPLEMARRLADRGELALARPLVEAALAEPSVEAFHLLGVIAQGEGRLDEAERCFGKALYLDAAHYSSLVHMALLRERRGDPTAAQFRVRASRLGRVGGSGGREGGT